MTAEKEESRVIQVSLTCLNAELSGPALLRLAKGTDLETLVSEAAARGCFRGGYVVGGRDHSLRGRSGR